MLLAFSVLLLIKNDKHNEINTSNNSNWILSVIEPDVVVTIVFNYYDFLETSAVYSNATIDTLIHNCNRVFYFFIHVLKSIEIYAICSVLIRKEGGGKGRGDRRSSLSNRAIFFFFSVDISFLMNLWAGGTECRITFNSGYFCNVWKRCGFWAYSMSFFVRLSSAFPRFTCLYSWSFIFFIFLLPFSFSLIYIVIIPCI